MENNLPIPVAYTEIPPFKVGEVISDVVYGTENVLYNTEQVTNTSRIVREGLREVIYPVVTRITPTIKYTFAKYKDGSFVDWKSYDGTGVDAPATLLTGFDGMGDYQRTKQVPYLTLHYERTEDGFYTDGNGDIWPTNESSCLVQSQWDWTNSITAGRWGREFQGYRYRRGFIPENAGSDFDTGFSVISTKNKLRGKGKVLSLQFKTEPEKNCILLGWSSLTNVGNNV